MPKTLTVTWVLLVSAADLARAYRRLLAEEESSNEAQLRMQQEQESLIPYQQIPHRRLLAEEHQFKRLKNAMKTLLKHSTILSSECKDPDLLCVLEEVQKAARTLRRIQSDDGPPNLMDIQYLQNISMCFDDLPSDAEFDDPATLFARYCDVNFEDLLTQKLAALDEWYTQCMKDEKFKNANVALVKMIRIEILKRQKPRRLGCEAQRKRVEEFNQILEPFASAKSASEMESQLEATNLSVKKKLEEQRKKEQEEQRQRDEKEQRKRDEEESAHRIKPSQEKNLLGSSSHLSARSESNASQKAQSLAQSAQGIKPPQKTNLLGQEKKEQSTKTKSLGKREESSAAASRGYSVVLVVTLVAIIFVY